MLAKGDFTSGWILIGDYELVTKFGRSGAGAGRGVFDVYDVRGAGGFGGAGVGVGGVEDFFASPDGEPDYADGGDNGTEYESYAFHAFAAALARRIFCNWYSRQMSHMRKMSKTVRSEMNIEWVTATS